MCVSVCVCACVCMYFKVFWSFIDIVIVAVSSKLLPPYAELPSDVSRHQKQDLLLNILSSMKEDGRQQGKSNVIQ